MKTSFNVQNKKFWKIIIYHVSTLKKLQFTTFFDSEGSFFRNCIMLINQFLKVLKHIFSKVVLFLISFR